MRTPFRGTRGGVPVRSAHAVLHTPAHHATAYGNRTVGALRPVIFASFPKIPASVKFSDPRMYRSPARPRSQASRCPAATSRASTTFSPVSMNAGMPPLRKSATIWPVGVGFTS